MTTPPITVRNAQFRDLGQMIALLADDPLGLTREDARSPPAPAYVAAFRAIEVDPHQMLLVAARGEQVIGMLQLTFIPGLSRQGAWRGQIESVRVARSARGAGLGRRLFEHAVEACRKHHCTLVQLTTDASRDQAQEFYASLGFQPSHIGYKLSLAP